MDEHANLINKRYSRCDSCCSWHWSHKDCPPEWVIYHPEYMGRDTKTVRADSAEQAALVYAELYNESGDYSLMNGNNAVIIVEREGQQHSFTISARLSIDYEAKQNFNF